MKPKQESATKPQALPAIFVCATSGGCRFEGPPGQTQRCRRCGTSKPVPEPEKEEQDDTA